MSTFVLVHGAWQGKWAWEKVVPKLEAAGHKVVALDLPGSGDDYTDSKTINLTAYVDFLEKEIRDLNEKVILVGHSMGGVVVTQTAERIADCIEKVVYLGAFLPANGDSLGSLSEGQDGPTFTVDMNTLTAEIVPETIVDTFLNETKDEAIIAAGKEKMRPQPLGPFQEPVKLTERFANLSKFYIETVNDHAIPIAFQRQMQKNTYLEKIYSLDADHSPFFSATDETVKILLQLAQ